MPTQYKLVVYPVNAGNFLWENDCRNPECTKQLYLGLVMISLIIPLSWNFTFFARWVDYGPVDIGAGHGPDQHRLRQLHRPPPPLQALRG